MLELSKKDKKVVRQIIEIGLLREFEQGIQKIQSVIAQCQTDKDDARQTYLKLYETLMNHDKHIARRYDGMTGSKYVWVLMAQLADGIIVPEDLEILDKAARQYIIAKTKFFTE